MASKGPHLGDAVRLGDLIDTASTLSASKGPHLGDAVRLQLTGRVNYQLASASKGPHLGDAVRREALEVVEAARPASKGPHLGDAVRRAIDAGTRKVTVLQRGRILGMR